MISKTQRLGYNVEVFASCKSENLLSYKSFYSYCDSSSFPRNEILIYFPHTLVNVKKIKIRTSTDVFPENWEVARAFLFTY